MDRRIVDSRAEFAWSIAARVASRVCASARRALRACALVYQAPARVAAAPDHAAITDQSTAMTGDDNAPVQSAAGRLGWPLPFMVPFVVRTGATSHLWSH
jgi:hypothetical protein